MIALPWHYMLTQRSILQVSSAAKLLCSPANGGAA